MICIENLGNFTLSGEIKRKIRVYVKTGIKKLVFRKNKTGLGREKNVSVNRSMGRNWFNGQDEAEDGKDRFRHFH
jgi:hypothetical protein